MFFNTSSITEKSPSNIPLGGGGGMTTLLKFDQFTQIALYCKPEWFIVIAAIYIVLRTDT